MKNYLKNYFTPSEQKVLMIILGIGFLILLVMNEPFNALYSEEISADSIKADIEEPYQLILDIRKASKEELILIKGIGAATADKIIAFRDSVKITSNYDLLNVKGIGEKSLTKWLPYFKVLAGDSLRTDQTTQKSVEKQTEKVPAIAKHNKLDINKASKEDLIKVKGIGEVKASQIIEFRNKQKGLSNMQELLSIKGIGKKTLAKIEEQFYIGKK